MYRNIHKHPVDLLISDMLGLTQLFAERKRRTSSACMSMSQLKRQRHVNHRVANILFNGNFNVAKKYILPDAWK